MPVEPVRHNNVRGVSGANQAVAAETIAKGDAASTSAVEADRRALYSKKPVRTTYETVYIDGDGGRKTKISETRWWKDGQGHEHPKTRVCCILKGGRVVSGKVPPGMEIKLDPRKAKLGGRQPEGTEGDRVTAHQPEA